MAAQQNAAQGRCKRSPGPVLVKEKNRLQMCFNGGRALKGWERQSKGTSMGMLFSWGLGFFPWMSHLAVNPAENTSPMQLHGHSANDWPWFAEPVVRRVTSKQIHRYMDTSQFELIFKKMPSRTCVSLWSRSMLIQ